MQVVELRREQAAEVVSIPLLWRGARQGGVVEPRREQAAEVVSIPLLWRGARQGGVVEPRLEQAAEAVSIPLLWRGARQGGVVEPRLERRPTPIGMYACMDAGGRASGTGRRGGRAASGTKAEESSDLYNPFPQSGNIPSPPQTAITTDFPPTPAQNSYKTHQFSNFRKFLVEKRPRQAFTL